MLLAEGLWSQRRKGRAHRRWREAKEHFDELVQMDGRFRPWLEQHGSKGCLMNMMDGATATRRGRPDAVWAEVRTPGDRDDRRPFCAGQRAVERNHGTHQDRPVKKMRRIKTGSYETANEYLEGEYLSGHNRRFAHAAAVPGNYHRQAPSGVEVDEVFRLETGRVIGNDWVVRYENRFLQVQRQAGPYAPAKAKVYDGIPVRSPPGRRSGQASYAGKRNNGETPGPGGSRRNATGTSGRPAEPAGSIHKDH